MKKLLALVLAATMMLGTALTAFAAQPGDAPEEPAAETYTITIADAMADHTYTVYQIFTGDLDESGAVLSNVKYGQSYGTAGDAVAKDVLEGIKDANAFAASIAASVSNPIGTLSSSSTTLDVPAGYYLVLDTSASKADNDAISDFIVEVVADVEIAPKAVTVPSSDKQIDSEPTTATATADDAIANKSAGDDVDFTLIATMPDAATLAAYDTYKVVFHDTQVGLDNVTAIKAVKVDGTALNADEYTFTPNGASFTVTIDDVKTTSTPAAAGSVITVEYTTKISASAVHTSTITNEYYLEYSNDPNSESTGTTPKDVVTAFVFELTFDKVDEDGEALSGAGFTLYKKNAEGEYVAVGEEQTGVTTFDFDGLGAGDYKLSETTTPDGYNTMADAEFTIVAEAAENADGVASVTTLAIRGLDGFAPETTQDGGFTGIIDGDIANFPGLQLPSTGGIGTTIFYVVGGIMVLGAAILLITKKRMSAE